MSFLTKDKKYPYPSRFGSHASMVVKVENSKVICEDEFGEYETEKWRLDNGLADPNRWGRDAVIFKGEKK